ncbi:hypothetical protein UFOVP650_72 [uncultured Caudovirales phage]|uniref:Uncharacterized protein n=1 Tax=uncultured Caudovirales phage TaxID=2100421 RepID=A0A6J5N8I5_9CAUD|nr:hypothetical protein UFOVP650_72 [uncultured Caudovirales phage]
MAQCPRRDESFAQYPSQADEFLTRGSSRPFCSFCGSVSGDELMAYIEAGGELTPTDKNYKAYLSGYAKFYYQHLSEEQRQRFVALMNEGKVKLAHPGHFYVMPFFMAAKRPETAANS